MRCTIRREPNWNGYPRFTVYSERKELILAARKRKKSMSANYILSSDADKLHKNSDTIVGKVQRLAC